MLGESVHASAVLACVAGGLYIRQSFSSAVAPATRIQARAVWDLLIFVLNGVIFILIGLQFGAQRAAMPSGSFGPVLLTGVILSLVAIVVRLLRLLWVPLAAALPRWVSAALRKRDPLPPRSHIFLTSWTGMRGIVTLAAALALALPLTTATGAPFPFRAEIIVISFVVILATLVVQGLSLPPLIRFLRIEEGSGLEDEVRLAREHAATAALTRLDQVVGEEWLKEEHVERLRVQYGRLVERFSGSAPVDGDATRETTEAFQRLCHETLTAERMALIGLRNDGTISDDVLHHLEHELDVEALRHGIGERQVTR